MSMPSGTRLGPYEIVAAIGAGGMGEVYKARDTRLDRAVAIKILPESLASDPQFRERFDREARAISQLTHPHICTLYDIGESSATAFLVMEYLEGETLAQRLKKGAMPLDEALTIAIQIADALSVAHRHGIVHRDLKPGNVMLTKGSAKLLDFGLAKTAGASAGAAGLSMLPTTPVNLTAQGTILGTFQYMAPEQLEGHEADARSDIFAFGALVYELVSGRKAFEGRSHASLIAAILEHDPPALTSLQPLAPTSLDHIVAKCLAKNPDDRWQSARDVATELKWLASTHQTRTAFPAPPTVVSALAIRAPIVWSAAVAIGLGAVAAAVVVTRVSRAPARDVARSIVTTLPAEHLLAFPTDQTTNEGRPSRTSMAWSPDGQSVAFSAVLGGRQQLFVRALNQLEATPIAGTDGASNPFFSPDGKWIGFSAQRALRKVAVSGGPPTIICELGGTIARQAVAGAEAGGLFGASWGDDGSIVYSLEREGLWRVRAAGGTPERVSRPDRQKGELKHLLPQMLPGSRAILFTVTHTPLPKWDDTEVVVQELANGTRRARLESAADGRYVASGHIVYVQRGTIMAAPFNLAGLKVTGGAIGVVAGVMQSANTTNEAFDSGAGQFAVSSGGSLLYMPGGIFPDAERTLVWVSRTGVEEPLPLPVRAYVSPRLSPDGKLITVWTQGDRNVWIYDLARRSLTRVNVDGRNARSIWAPDGKRIAFSSTVAGPEENAFLVSADGSGAPDRLVTCDCPSHAASWTPDGRTIVGVDRKENYDIVLIDVAGSHPKTPLLHGKADQYYPDISPDGHWIAYASNESGKNEVYVQPFPDLGARHQISTDGGTAPAWSRDGRELFYTTTATAGGQASVTRMMTVAVTATPTFVASPPRMLFEGRYGATAIVRPYDVSPDGQRFLMVKQKDRVSISASQMILVQNWLEELKARVPTK
jgi:eukaryotic-like serine/threonine-protein kinase